MLQQDSKKSPAKVEVAAKPVKESNNKKKEVEGHEFKLSKFKNVESKVKPLMANPNAKH
jgi:hypothetical protein